MHRLGQDHRAGHHREHRRQHRERRHGRRPVPQLTLVAAGLGVALVPRLARMDPPGGVAVVAVEPEPARRVTLAWRSASTVRPAMEAAISALRDAWRG